MGKSTTLYILFETAAGFGLAQVKEWDQIGADAETFAEAVQDAARFKQVCSMVAFHAFSTAEEALENMNAVAKGEATELLTSFLDQNLPSKRKRVQLGIVDISLAKTLSDLDYPVVCDKNILELHRGCRTHITKMVKQFKQSQLATFQVGLGHSYSRNKIQFDPKRQDKPVQNGIALLDMIDKNVNMFAMRVKEWYGWHFPELAKIVSDNGKFCELVKLIGVKEDFLATLDEEGREKLVAIVDGDEDLAEEILQAANMSMGQEMVETDVINIDQFATQVAKLTEQRRALSEYLSDKLDIVAPNLKCVVGEVLAARLISHAGSLVNLAKAPASTVQILGAEKALFRALKKKGNTPKYGLLFQSSAIGRASQKNKGRISRYLANKCSMASRIDAFGDVVTPVFGEKMAAQVEDRLLYLSDGVVPKKNEEVMAEAQVEYEAIVKKERKRLKKAAKASA